MPEAAIRSEIAEGVAVVTIDRPERRNAMSREAWLEFRSVIDVLSADQAVRGMILTGAGDRAFAAGADIGELADRPAFVALDGLVQGILLDLEALPFPTVAALNGHALGGGWELALACDLRVAVPSALVGFPEVGLGILPGAGGTLRLLQHVGIGLAKEWIFTGRLLTAEEAGTPWAHQSDRRAGAGTGRSALLDGRADRATTTAPSHLEDPARRDGAGSGEPGDGAARVHAHVPRTGSLGTDAPLPGGTDAARDPGALDGR